MSQPVGTPVGELAAVVSHYDVTLDRYVGQDLFPITPVTRDEGHWSSIPRQTLMQMPSEDLRRANTQPAYRVSGGMNRTPFVCERRGVEQPVDVNEGSTPEEQIEAEIAAATVVNRIMRNEHEQEVAAAVFNETNFPVSGGSALGGTVGTDWSDASATIVSDVNDANTNGINGTGMKANTMVITETTHNHMSTNTQVLDKFRGTNGDINKDPLTGLLDLDGLSRVFNMRILVPHVPIIEHAAGVAVDTATQIWTGSYAFLCHLAPSGGIKMPTLGRTFVNVTKGGFLGLDSYYEDRPTSNLLRAQSWRSNNFVDGKLGHLLKLSP